MQDEVGFPDKEDQNKWSVSGLNDILNPDSHSRHLIFCNEQPFLSHTMCVLYSCIMSARCYPFNMSGHCFHNMNLQLPRQGLSHRYTRHILIMKLEKLCRGYPLLILFWQDIVLTVPPYPYAVGEPEKCCVVRPQLFFVCHLQPRGRRQVQIVFYSTFELVDLPGGGPMEAVGLQGLYEPSPTPILYVGLAATVLGRVPVMPYCPSSCFS